MLTTRQFAARYEAFERCGVSLVRIFRSPVNALRAHAEGATALPFPVLADPGKKVYRLYGVGTSLGSLFSFAARERMRQARQSGLKPKWRDALRDGIGGSPADFLIGPDGRVREAHYGEHVADSVNPELALRWIAATP